MDGHNEDRGEDKDAETRGSHWRVWAVRPHSYRPCEAAVKLTNFDSTHSA